MARLCEELAAVLLAGDPPHESLAPALLTSLPGVSCLIVALASGGGQVLRVQPLLEAGSVRRGPLPAASAGLDTASWRCFATGKVLRGRDGVCSASKARFRDWAALQQKYGASTCITIPLEVGAGVVGALTAAGGPKMDRKAVQVLAARLAEALLRRTTEALLKAATERLEAAGAADEAACLVASYPKVLQRPDGPAAIDLRCAGSADAGGAVAKDAAAAASAAGVAAFSSGSHPGTPRANSAGAVPWPAAGAGSPPELAIGMSPFSSIAAAAASSHAASMASLRSEASMRTSSFEAYQELKYFCLECRAENCVDLPQWHWGKLVDQLCKGGRRQNSGSLSTATASAAAALQSSSGGGGGANDSSVASTSHAIASAGLARMARLAAMCARDDDDDYGPLSARSSTRASSTTDLTHPAAQRAASGQLRRISPRDLSESPSESPTSSRAPSASCLRAGSGSLSLEMPSPPATPAHSRRPPLAPPPEDNPLRTQSADQSAAARHAVLAYTAGLRRRSDTHGPGGSSMVAQAAAAARTKLAHGSPDGADGIRAVSSYVDNLRRASRGLAVTGHAQRRTGGAGSPPTPPPAPALQPAAPSKDTQLPPDDLKAGSLRAGSVYEDDTARAAVAAYKAMRSSSGAPPRGGRPRSPPVPPLQHPSVARVTPPGGQSRASTTRSVADKSVEGVKAARTMVDDYMASLQTRSLAAAAADRRSSSPPPLPSPCRFTSHSSGGAAVADGLHGPGVASSADVGGGATAVPSATGCDAPATGGNGGGGDGDGGGAKSVVDNYLAALRSRSMAARVSRGPGGAGSAQAAAGASAGSAAGSGGGLTGGNAGGQAPPGQGDARATVDAYMSSLRKQSAAVMQARGVGAPAAAQPAESAEHVGDGQAAVADYMKSLRRRSVAAAATAAARQESEKSDQMDAAVDAATADAARDAGSCAATPSSGGGSATPSPLSPHQQAQQPQQQRGSGHQSMTEARAAVAAHMEALRQRLAGLRDAAAERQIARSIAAGSGGSASPSASSWLSSTEAAASSPAPGSSAQSGSAPAAGAENPSPSASAPAPLNGQPDSGAAAAASPVADLSTAKAVVGNYMEELRRRSAAIGGGASRSPSLPAGSLRSGSVNAGGNGGDLRAVAAAAAGGGGGGPSSKTSSSGSERSGGSEAREDARSAVANYMENLRARGGAGGVPAGTSVRSSGSLRSGSLRLASIQLDPVDEADRGERQASFFDGAAAYARGSSETDDGPQEAAAEKSDSEAHKAVATYIESLKRASASAPPARPKTGIRVDFGGGEGPTVALASASATSSVMSSTGSFMQSDPMSAISGGGGSAPTAATAVSAYMAALKQRANTAAAAGYGSGGQGGQGNAAAGGVVHAASAPDAKSAVDAYLAGLKSRSAQAAMLRQLSSSTAGSSRASSMAVSFSGHPMEPRGASPEPGGAVAAAGDLSAASSSSSRLGSGSLRAASLRGSGGSDDGGWQRGASLGASRGAIGLETLEEGPSGELADDASAGGRPPTAAAAAGGSDKGLPCRGEGAPLGERQLSVAEDPEEEVAAAAAAFEDAAMAVGPPKAPPAIKPVSFAAPAAAGALAGTGVHQAAAGTAPAPE